MTAIEGAFAIWEVTALRKEAQHLAQLEHPNIVRVYAWKEAAGSWVCRTRRGPRRRRSAPAAALASNSGKTQTHALKKGCPAINKRTVSIVLPFDQRGAPFKRSNGSWAWPWILERSKGSRV
jgi:hypothetical protein